MPELPERPYNRVEYRLIVLYAIDRLGPCTNLQLLQFMADNEIMNYFDLQPTLMDLRNNGQVVRATADAEYAYTLTDAGHETLEMFSSRMPASRVELIDLVCDKWRARFKAEHNAKTETIQHENGEYELQLKVMDNDTPLMQLNLFLPSEEAAQKMSESWPAKAQTVYAFVMRELSGGRQ